MAKRTTTSAKDEQVAHTIISDEQLEQDTVVRESETEESSVEDSQISESEISETDFPGTPVLAVATEESEQEDNELSVGEVQEEPEQPNMLKIVSFPELRDTIFKASKIIATVVAALLVVALVALAAAADATVKAGRQFRLLVDRFLDYRANEGMAEAVSIVVGEILRENVGKLSVRVRGVAAALPEVQGN